MKIILKYPLVTIIILNWNGKKDTIECLESLKHITYPNYEILLVDNGSTDGSVECFRERYPGMEIIETMKNLGYAEGNNVGIRRSIKKGVDYVLLLNNDTVVDPGFLNELVIVAETDNNIGFAGPKVYYYDYKGRKDVINFAGGKLNKWKGKTYHIGIKEIDNGQFDKIKIVDYIEGSCLLAKKELIDKIGLLNPNYFTYWEENDWCIRGLEAKYNCVFVPNAKIWHKIGAFNIRNKNVYYITRNRFWFLKEHISMVEYFLFIIYFFAFEILLTIFISIFYYRDLNRIIQFYRGIVDGL